MDINRIYKKWLYATADLDLKNQLMLMTEAEINDAFYQNLQFGTGGLRGIIGAGTNRMNIYTVNKATQGLCDFLKKQKQVQVPSVAIAYDNRIKSEEFARSAAGVIAASGGEAYIFAELMPTPILSYAVRELKCDAGIVITASHNPAQYNGYKVYGSDGCQITLEMAESIQKCIEQVNIFTDMEVISFTKALQSGAIHFVPQNLLTKYLELVEQCSINPKILQETDLKVIYTPLNGTGNKPVREILKRAGLKNLMVVPEQEQPDGYFTTCQKPNPEEPAVFKLAIELAERIDADLLFATDPDCDRIGIAVNNGRKYTLLTGNETGCLLLNYILSQKTTKNSLPQRPVIIKTIVTSKMANLIAKEYGVRVIDTLTGFKYIGEQIGLLEQKQEEDNYVFGFEESYGYLPEIFVRDKDAVSTSLLICEMAAFYKSNKLTLLEELKKLYEKYGYWKHKLISFSFEGPLGMGKMQAIMNNFRNGSITNYAGLGVLKTDDYLNSITVNRETLKKDSLFLPRSDVLLFLLENDCEIVIRPSGTEPKLKCYLTVKSKGNDGAMQILAALENDLIHKIELC